MQKCMFCETEVEVGVGNICIRCMYNFDSVSSEKTETKPDSIKTVHEIQERPTRYRKRIVKKHSIIFKK